MPQQAFEVHMVDLQLIDHPEWNPGNRHLDSSLSDSILKHGLQQPVQLRKIGKRYEVVFGNRRVAGCREAGLTEIAAMVRELDEEQAKELCGIENLRRNDLAPLEEADWFRMFVELPGQTLSSAADSFGRDVPYVADRVHLANNLSNIWRDAYLEGEQGAGDINEWKFSALAFVAKLSHDGQASLFQIFKNGGIPSVKELSREVKALITEIATAPWPLADSNLVEGKPCQGCNERSDFFEQLSFAGVCDSLEEVPRCLNLRCWQAKGVAFVEQHSEAFALQNPEGFFATREWYVGGMKELHGLRIVSTQSHEWQECEHGDSDAVPVMIIKGHDAGRTIYLRRVSRERVERRKGGNKLTLPEKEERLNQLRCKVSAEMLGLKLDPDFNPKQKSLHYKPSAKRFTGDISLSDDHAENAVMKVLALLLVFGTPKNFHSVDGSVTDSWNWPLSTIDYGDQTWGKDFGRWDLFDWLCQRDAGDLLSEGFSQVLSVLLGRLHDPGPGPARNRLKNEMMRLADLVDVDPKRIWSDACDTKSGGKSRPKAWDKDDGFKTVKRPRMPKAPDVHVLPPEVQKQLNKFFVWESATIARLTDGRKVKLDPQVTSHLACLGGREKHSADQSATEERAFLFSEQSGRVSVDEAIYRGEYVWSGDLDKRFFETKRDHVDLMLDRALEMCGAKSAKKLSFFDPTAGLGAVAVEARRRGFRRIQCAEIHKPFAKRLEAADFKVQVGDFLDMKPGSVRAGKGFDVVATTPPFDSGEDLRHFVKAWDFVKPGGVLVGVLAFGMLYREDKQACAFRGWLADVGGFQQVLENLGFVGGFNGRWDEVLLERAWVSKPTDITGQNGILMLNDNDLFREYQVLWRTVTVSLRKPA